MSAAQPAPLTFAPNAFVRVGKDESVTVIVNHSEMGQGTYTALSMIVAEELEADWSKVRAEPATVDPAYNHVAYGIQLTGGSSSTYSEWDRLRKAGAAARMMLISAAAATWNVEPASCRAESGQVIHSGTGRRLSYGKLVEKASRLTPPQEVTLKDPKDFTIIGKPTKRLDTPDKTNGKAIFGLDVNLPGMLVAMVARRRSSAGRSNPSTRRRPGRCLVCGMWLRSNGVSRSWPTASGPPAAAARRWRSSGTTDPWPRSTAAPKLRSTRSSPSGPGPWPGKTAMSPPRSPEPPRG